MAFNSKATIPQLETKLANLRQEHALALATFKKARSDIAAIEEISDASNRSLLEHDLAEARASEVASRTQMREIEQKLKATEREIVTVQEAPARAASAEQIRNASKTIERAWKEFAPAIDAVTDVLRAASYQSLMGASPDLMIAARAFEHARDVVHGGALECIKRDTEMLASNILSGSADFALGVPAAQQQAEAIKVAWETERQITEHHNEAVKAGKKLRVA